MAPLPANIISRTVSARTSMLPNFPSACSAAKSSGKTFAVSRPFREALQVHVADLRGKCGELLRAPALSN